MGMALSSNPDLPQITLLWPSIHDFMSSFFFLSFAALMKMKSLELDFQVPFPTWTTNKMKVLWEYFRLYLL